MLILGKCEIVPIFSNLSVVNSLCCKQSMPLDYESNHNLHVHVLCMCTFEEMTLLSKAHSNWVYCHMSTSFSMKKSFCIIDLLNMHLYVRPGTFTFMLINCLYSVTYLYTFLYFLYIPQYGNSAFSKCQSFIINLCQWNSKGHLKISATVQLVWWRVFDTITISEWILPFYCSQTVWHSVLGSPSYPGSICVSCKNLKNQYRLLQEICKLHFLVV